MVYWVIAKESSAPAPGGSAHARTLERVGPFENRDVAAQARDAVVNRYRGRAQPKVEIVCDFT